MQNRFIHVKIEKDAISRQKQDSQCYKKGKEVSNFIVPFHEKIGDVLNLQRHIEA